MLLSERNRMKYIYRRFIDSVADIVSTIDQEAIFHKLKKELKFHRTSWTIGHLFECSRLRDLWNFGPYIYPSSLTFVEIR